MKLKVFTENYTELASVLPTESLTNHLVKESIINVEEQKEILQTIGQSGAAVIVLRKIRSSLEEYSTEKFDALISVMGQYGDTSCLSLVSKMRRELLQSTTGKAVH